MALLTWRNVDAPRDSGAQQSLNSAAHLLGNATSGLSSALGQYGDRETLARLARYSDPAALQGDVASGAFDTSNASAAALGKVMSRPAALLDNAATQQTTQHFAAMSPLQQQQQALANEAGTLRNTQQAWQDPISRDNFEQQRAADAQLQAARSGGQAATPANANALLAAAVSEGRSVPYVQRLREGLLGMHPGFDAAAGAGISLSPTALPGSAGAAPAAGVALPEALTTALTASEKTAGLPAGLMNSIVMQETGGREEFLKDPAKYHYGPGADGKRKSTAFGPYGILESTAKDPGYGVAPLKNKSLEEQTRFATEYMAARIKQAGSLEGGLAGYGEGNKYAGDVIARMSAPGRQQVAMTGATAALANTLGGSQAGAETAARIQAALDQPYGSDTSLSTVVNRAVGKDGALAGMNRDDAQEAVREVMKATNLDNAAAAMELVKNAGIDRAGFPFINRRDVVDKTQLAAEIAKFKSGAYLSSAQAGNQARANIADTATVNAAVDAARANLTKAKENAARGAPGSAPIVAQAQAEYDAALAAGNQVNQALQQVGARNANFTPPPARPPSAGATPVSTLLAGQVPGTPPATAPTSNFAQETSNFYGPEATARRMEERKTKAAERKAKEAAEDAEDARQKAEREARKAEERRRIGLAFEAMRR